MPWGAWVFVPSPHRVPLLCCFLQEPQKGRKLRIGLLVALRGCHGVVVWYYDVDMAADELDEEEMDPARTKGPGLAPLECPSAAEVQSFIKESRPR